LPFFFEKEYMKVSLITVTYNTATYLPHCIESVLNQTYPDIEYILIDGNSTDGTQEIIQAHEDRLAYWVSEPDTGIYDAMNKGIRQATGDMIGMLNADDFYVNPSVIQNVVRKFTTNEIDALYGDVVFVDAEQTEKVKRYYPGKGFSPQQMRRGMMPPHPTFFVKRNLYEQYGLFDTSYEICADYEFMVRLFCVHKISYAYLPQVMVAMRTGGKSTQSLNSNLQINREMLRACQQHNIPTNLFWIYSKYTTKIFQLFHRPPRTAQ